MGASHVDAAGPRLVHLAYDFVLRNCCSADQAGSANATGETPMETDDAQALGELENNPELLQQLVDNLGQGGSSDDKVG